MSYYSKAPDKINLLHGSGRIDRIGFQNLILQQVGYASDLSSFFHRRFQHIRKIYFSGHFFIFSQQNVQGLLPHIFQIGQGNVRILGQGSFMLSVFYRQLLGRKTAVQVFSFIILILAVFDKQSGVGTFVIVMVVPAGGQQ